jgi:hypothetical protein
MAPSLFQRLVGDALRFWFPDTQIIEDYRPEWLHGMEIDFYLPKYKVGIEVQGRQHYLWVPKYQATLSAFQAQKKRDKLKLRLAQQQGIQVIVISGFKGIDRRLQNVIPDRIFRTLPLKLKQAMKTYNRRVHRLNQTKWVAFKVRKGKPQGTNRLSANILKRKKTGRK